ncbi:MAG: thermonuclease family protein [Rhizobiales bacterium]|nr:thermonuclease family protein [Hyphomicrobiales bacterium]NRB13122.1 thermonuclease family protein [Hyphomicrobiales bacterium]
MKLLQKIYFNRNIVRYLFLAVFFLMPTTVFAKEILRGVYSATVLKITDSDTIKLNVSVWPLTKIEVGLRVNGIDTPEKYRPKCQLEKSLAKAASDFVKTFIKVGDIVEIENIFIGKYAGRVIGDLYFFKNDNRISLSALLLEQKIAVPYFGGKKTKDWCKAPN